MQLLNKLHTLEFTNLMWHLRKKFLSNSKEASPIIQVRL